MFEMAKCALVAEIYKMENMIVCQEYLKWI